MPDSTLTDPLGRRIMLLDSTWHGHVLKGHPELSRVRVLVEGAVQAPLEIRISNADPDCRLYYGPGPRLGIIMQVVVDIVQGLVKTAHFAKKRTGGATEWLPPNP